MRRIQDRAKRDSFKQQLTVAALLEEGMISGRRTCDFDASRANTEEAGRGYRQKSWVMKFVTVDLHALWGDAGLKMRR